MPALAILLPIARFPAVTFRHPHGFNALSVGKPNQVPHRPVLRDKFLLDLRRPNHSPALRQTLTKLPRQCRHLLQRLHPLPVDRVHDLLGTIAALTRLDYQRDNLFAVQTE